ncbi:hypothetical protein [Aequorivita viscosa]|uniref:Uncharacterized protein n=1 Tax=Aequorivita viscosa TaxID=797419 RepID=A0A1M6M1A3_9FLAO|nr:hypothetical protein [Aequorivita viscosa]SDX31714.1 hypothetical protein SAMN05216556_12445 [Aequorivita viscosa]SHJ77093.1 hypothetical protein SAMN04487908_12515 [Aequorivita viscosa]
MNQKCWICGSNSDSGEHKFKASDLKRNYGKKFKKHNLTYISGNDEPINLQSYKPKELIFPKVICVNCNVKVTCPHDTAYDIFVKYIESNYNLMFTQKSIDFEKVYGRKWLDGKKDLYRYFAKHAGCKVVTAGTPYDLGDLADFILGKSHSDNLKIHFQLKEGLYFLVKRLNENIKYAHAYNGSTSYFGDNINALSYCGWSSYQWVSTNWILSHNINKSSNDYSNNIQPLEIKYFGHCKPFNENMKFDELLKNVEYQGIERWRKKSDIL